MAKISSSERSLARTLQTIAIINVSICLFKTVHCGILVKDIGLFTSEGASLFDSCTDKFGLTSGCLNLWSAVLSRTRLYMLDPTTMRNPHLRTLDVMICVLGALQVVVNIGFLFGVTFFTELGQTSLENYNCVVILALMVDLIFFHVVSGLGQTLMKWLRSKFRSQRRLRQQQASQPQEQTDSPINEKEMILIEA